MASETSSISDINNKIFNIILSDIDKGIQSEIPQPIVIVGVDGSGKTTLLRQLYNATVQSGHSSVWMDGRSIFSVKDITLHAGITSNSVIFIDDIDFFFTRCSYSEQYELRSLLYNEGAPMIIGTVEKILPAFSEYKAPFFEGLKLIHIPPITLDDTNGVSFSDPEEQERAQKLLRLLPKTIRSVDIIRNIIRNNDNTALDITALISEFSPQYKQFYQSLPTYSQQILSAIGNTPAPGKLLSDIRETTGLPTSVLSIYLRNLCTAGTLTVDKSLKKKYKYTVKDPLFGEWLSFNPN
ncbi:MAG: hypothetical protein K2L05_00525 [Muribaculaceae bacterium]|nr:hypothetical protein [Muribaculaceae bacterium]